MDATRLAPVPIWKSLCIDVSHLGYLTSTPSTSALRAVAAVVDCFNLLSSVDLRGAVVQ